MQQMMLLHCLSVRCFATLACALALLIIAFPVAAIANEEWVTTFVRFVDWPDAPADNVIIICQPADSTLLALDGVQVRGMTLRLKRLQRPRDAERCHVFSALSQPEADWRAWLAAFKSRPTLSIGPSSRFCEAGGAICVVKDGATGVEKYQVNLDAIARAGLKVRLPLLRHQRPAKPNAE